MLRGDAGSKPAWGCYAEFSRRPTAASPPAGLTYLVVMERGIPPPISGRRSETGTVAARRYGAVGTCETRVASATYRSVQVTAVLFFFPGAGLDRGRRRIC